MAKIITNIVRGGLGRQSADTDTWGGLFVEVDALPVGWTANEVKRIFKPEDLESYGITEDAVNDNYKLAYWHVSEAFRLNPNATIYMQIGIPADDGVLPATVMTAFANATNKVKRFGLVFSTETIDVAAVGAVNDAMDAMYTTYAIPARCVVSFKKEAADAIPDLSGASNYRTMVDIGNDLTTDGLAKTVFDSSLGMCGCAGTILGQMLLLSVHQKPSWRTYPVNDGTHYLLLGDINGDSVEDLTQAQIDAYGTQGVNLVVRTLRDTDAYISNARMGGDVADDYAICTNGAVIDKALTLAYDAMIPQLDGPVYVDPSNGKIAPESIALLESIGYNAINNNMVIGRTGNKVEVSVDLATGSLPLDAVYVDPEQNVLQTEQIAVEIRIVPVGSASTIIINIGLKLPS